jgi:hypothetical protein
MALTSLDVSHNELVALPENLFALPNLVTLNISHNRITSLPFSAPFSINTDTLPGRLRSSRDGGSLFGPVIERAKQPLPKLWALDASNNKLTADGIDHEGGVIPKSLTKLNLSDNPLGGGSWQGASLLRALAPLKDLRELLLERAELSDDAFPPELLSADNPRDQQPFQSLCRLDLGETKVTEDGVRASLEGKVPQKLSFDLTVGEVPSGVLQVSVGRKVVKEAWEIEAEMRTKGKKGRGAGDQTSDIGANPSGTQPDGVQKEQWELEAEQGLNSEGARRRIRATAAANASGPKSTELNQLAFKKPDVIKEAWEIEAEQGLLSAGARRRAKAAAAAVEDVSNNTPADHLGSPASSSSTGAIISSPPYYHSTARSLMLPPSVPPARSGPAHFRNFSVTPLRGAAVNPVELVLPTATLPLSLICAQEFSRTLRTLQLANRRMDPVFSLPPIASGEVLLPSLEELNLEGCRLGDSVAVSRDDGVTRASEPLLPLITSLFPSLQTLDLSCNAITSAALTADVLNALILSTNSRKGLRHLRLRENRLDNLDGFAAAAESFRSNRKVPEWKMEELDVRDNAIGRLPPELGLIPMDVFLVSGNT